MMCGVKLECGRCGASVRTPIVPPLDSPLAGSDVGGSSGGQTRVMMARRARGSGSMPAGVWPSQLRGVPMESSPEPVYPGIPPSLRSPSIPGGAASLYPAFITHPHCHGSSRLAGGCGSGGFSHDRAERMGTPSISRLKSLPRSSTGTPQAVRAELDHGPKRQRAGAVPECGVLSLELPTVNSHQGGGP